MRVHPVLLEPAHRVLTMLAGNGPEKHRELSVVPTEASSDDVLVRVVAGTCSGVLATIAAWPFEVAATRAQVQRGVAHPHPRDVVLANGRSVASAPRFPLLAGLGWALGCAALGNVAFFFADAKLAQSLPPGAVVARSLGGAIAAAVVNTPLEVAKKRAIANSGGALALDAMTLLSPTVLGANVLPTVLGTTVQWVGYRVLLEHASRCEAWHSHPALTSGLVGVLAGMLAEVSTAPLNTIKSIVMTSQADTPPSMLSVARKVLSTAGAGGLFAGVHASLVKSVVPAFVMFAALPALTETTREIVCMLRGQYRQSRDYEQLQQQHCRGDW